MGHTAGVRRTAMIVVIADDLTGAAELAGVGWRHGLESEVQRVLALDSEAELVVADADTRLLPVGAAARRVAALAGACRGRSIDRVFMKVDSILRGHVVAEMTALMEGLGRTRGLLLPANPGLGRTIVRGRYFVNGVPLDKTEFARDPAYPVRSADVLDLLGPGRLFPVTSGGCGNGLPERGIVIGDAATSCDVETWAASLDASVVPAGAAEFFASFLLTCGYRPGVSAGVGFVPTSAGSSLFLSGSSSSASHEFCIACDSWRIPVVRMPVQLFDGLEYAQPLVA
ncbi:MAG: four-carbon acid sugar kinase family protein, partial [Anaerolineae bacterium]|nr:four-carbon acid sugar kinase family protein [Anaerolineae bacterium]